MSSKVLKNLSKIDSISFPKPNAFNMTGAISFPKPVSSIDLTFKKYNKGGHMGLRKFWKQYLPSVKFYNSDVAINVKRISLAGDEKDPEVRKNLENDPELIKKCPAEIKIEFEDSSKVVIDCLNKHSDDILKEFIMETGGEAIKEESLVRFASDVSRE